MGEGEGVPFNFAPIGTFISCILISKKIPQGEDEFLRATISVHIAV